MAAPLTPEQEERVVSIVMTQMKALLGVADDAFVRGFAVGGVVNSRAYVVGENSPELVMSREPTADELQHCANEPQDV